MKIYIVGAVASGKSTLARKMSERFCIPYQSLDEFVHIPDKNCPTGNRKREAEEREKLFYTLMEQPKWIIEDVGRPCFAEGLKQADVIVLLEIPTKLRNVRIIKRWIKQCLGIEKCIYRPQFKMLRSMLRWSKEYDLGKDNLKDRICCYKDKIVTIRNGKDIMKFLENVSI